MVQEHHADLYQAALRYYPGDNSWVQAMHAAGFTEYQARPRGRKTREETKQELAKEIPQAFQTIGSTFANFIEPIVMQTHAALYRKARYAYGSWYLALQANLKSGVTAYHTALQIYERQHPPQKPVAVEPIVEQEEEPVGDSHEESLPSISFGSEPMRLQSRQGFGRVHTLSESEVQYADQMKERLMHLGLRSDYTTSIVHTLVSMHRSSLHLLVIEGILSPEQEEKIATLDPRLDFGDLKRRLAHLLYGYHRGLAILRDDVHSEEVIQDLLRTHLLPWSTIQRYRRIYMRHDSFAHVEDMIADDPNLDARVAFLIDDLDFLQAALESDDVENYYREKVTQIRDELIPPMTMQEKPHRALSEDYRSLMDYLESNTRILKLLMSRPPLTLNYRFQRKKHERFIVQITNPEELGRLGRETELYDESNDIRFYVVQVHRSRNEIEIEPSSRACWFLQPEGTLTTIHNPVDIKQQYQLQNQILEWLENGKRHATGRSAYDHLLGLHFQQRLALSPIKSFFDPRIEADQSQATALQWAFQRPNVLLIEGPGGGGKTTMIVEMIRQAVAQGQTVIVVSQMHQAVDNALDQALKLLNDVLILRLGNDPRQFRYGTKRAWAGTFGLQGIEAEKAADVYTEFKRRRRIRREQGLGEGCVFVATNMGIGVDRFFNNVLLIQNNIAPPGLILMDETTRDNPSGALIPYRYAGADTKFVSIGDRRQLPPTPLTFDEEQYLRQNGVTSEDIERYSQGFFDFLWERGYADRIQLNRNYRAQKPVLALLSSYLFYDSTVVPTVFRDYDHETVKLLDIAPSATSTEFFEEEGVSETRSYFNTESGRKVLELVEQYLGKTDSQGIALTLKDITILTPYREQVEWIYQALKTAYPSSEDLPFVTTIDSYQGGQNKAIIYDFVRSNDRRVIGHVKDPRRFCVGYSRQEEFFAAVYDSRTFDGKNRYLDRKEDQRVRELVKRFKLFHMLTQGLLPPKAPPQTSPSPLRMAAFHIFSDSAREAFGEIPGVTETKNLFETIAHFMIALPTVEMNSGAVLALQQKLGQRLGVLDPRLKDVVVEVVNDSRLLPDSNNCFAGLLIPESNGHPTRFRIHQALLQVLESEPRWIDFIVQHEYRDQELMMTWGFDPVTANRLSLEEFHKVELLGQRLAESLHGTVLPETWTEILLNSAMNISSFPFPTSKSLPLLSQSSRQWVKSPLAGEVTFSYATPDSLEELVRFREENFRNHFSLDEPRKTEKYFRKKIFEIWAAKTRGFVVTVRNRHGLLLGYGLVYADGPTRVTLNELVVANVARENGLARALVAAQLEGVLCPEFGPVDLISTFDMAGGITGKAVQRFGFREITGGHWELGLPHHNSPSWSLPLMAEAA